MKQKSKLYGICNVALVLVLAAGLGPVSGQVQAPGTGDGPAPVEGGDAPVAAGTVVVDGAAGAGATEARALPAGAEAGWWATVEEGIRRSEYQITWQEQTYLEDVAAAYQAPNRAGNLRTYFVPEGAIVIPRLWTPESETAPWRWQVRLDAWGRTGALADVPAAALEVHENRIEYRRGDPAAGAGLVEWYRNDEEGLIQGFRLLAPPGGEGAGQPLQLVFAVSGDLLAEMVEGKTGIAFRTADGTDVLRYGRLQAVDSAGRSLPAWLALQGSTLLLSIDDTGASYPLEIAAGISGLSTDYDWALTFGQAGAEFGTKVATAGDVDGDGYSDVIIGAPNYDGGLAEQGAAFVYYGSRDGLYDFSDWYETIDHAGAHYGWSVATAGDVNCDGFADVIVGAPDYTNGAGQEREGGTWVYHGSPDGLHHDWSTHDEGNQAGAAFGLSVATAGDVNGDGCADVIVGAPLYQNGQSEEGRVWVWHGSPGGLSGGHNWRAESNRENASFGQSVATAGDINGDGYADIIVGAQRYTDGQYEEGAAFVWLGSRDGVNGDDDGTPANAHRHLQINVSASRFGWSVSSAGDVNGDGYADVIVGGPYYGHGQGSEGGAWLYLGAPAGLNAAPANQDEGNQADAHFGWSVASAGDVNGDGYGDVIVGAPGYRAGLDQQGQAWVWYGRPTSTGISSTNDWSAAGEAAEAFFGTSVATAGDVNGDGYSDVIVGAPGHGASTGRCYVYHGSSGTLGEAAGWTKASNMAQALFGWSVGTAGDVNGDGYADVIVGAPRWDGGQALEGGAWVYLGDDEGLTSAPHWNKEGGMTNAEFGSSVGTAGDVNGDGYDEVIVGAPGWHNPQIDEGAAFVYRGTSGGLLPAPLWSKASNQEGARFGTAVGTAGDVNGDGYADILVGAPTWQRSGEERGGAWAYYGTADGVHSAPDWYQVGDQAGAQFGQALSTAGDVNGDGYSDIIVGAPGWRGSNPSEGHAWVYHGSPGGLQLTARWDERGSRFNAQYGYSVGTAGDVNGDGYADVVVGAPYWWDDRENEGKVWVYHGSRAGLGRTSSWSREGGQVSAHYGFSVGTAGDVSGDGYADVIIGIQNGSGGQSYEGAASVYHGGYSGLGASVAWRGESDQTSAHYGHSVGTAGDVNGDGYADVIVGAPNFQRSGEKIDEGQAYLYYGNGQAGPSLRPRQMGTSPGQPVAHLGWSDSLHSFCVEATVQSPFGRGRVKLEIEVKPLGVPFDGRDKQQEASWRQDSAGFGTSLCATDLSAGTRYHWRARWRYKPGTTPWMPASRWVTMPWNGWNEQDLRTGGSRSLLPAVLRAFE